MPIISALISLQSANWKVRFFHLGDWLHTHGPTKWSLKHSCGMSTCMRTPLLVSAWVWSICWLSFYDQNQIDLGALWGSTSIQFPPCCTSALHKDQIPIWSSFPVRTINWSTRSPWNKVHDSPTDFRSLDWLMGPTLCRKCPKPM